MTAIGGDDGRENIRAWLRGDLIETDALAAELLSWARFFASERHAASVSAEQAFEQWWKDRPNV